HSLGDVIDELKNQPRVADKKYTLTRLLNIFIKVCEAMAFAHSKGVVHRDLKPDNIMVGEFGEVLVMDWGLAKVAATSKAKEIKNNTENAEHTKYTDSRFSELVESFRHQSGSDVTMDGSVSGTPLYMAPEQAEGRISEIGERTDVYALGAILYELLSLTPPVEGKTVQMLLLNAAENKIKPLKQARDSRPIPKELAAIAMKSLSKEQSDRYKDCDQLQDDIELFMEGRAVSAKEDNVVESIAKFIKRNKAVSISTGIAAVLLLGLGIFSYINIVAERDKANANLADFKALAAKAAPEFIKRTNTLFDSGKFGEALKSIDAAIALNQKEAEYYSLKSLILLCKYSYTEARCSAENALSLNKNSLYASDVVDLCKSGSDLKLTDGKSCLEIKRNIGNFMLTTRHVGAAGIILEGIKLDFSSKRTKFRSVYINKLKKALPDLIIEGTDNLRDVIINKDDFCIYLNKRGNLTSIDFLKDMPLTRIDVSFTELSDLSPLEGMPLNNLIIRNTNISDLTPLRGAPLTNLKALKSRITDLSPLKGAPLTKLEVSQTNIADLVPLKGMPLISLYCGETAVADLKPLNGMKLKKLSVHCTKISDLTPLKNMPLESLDIFKTQTTDLTPLEGMQLKEILFTPEDIKNGIDVIRSIKTLKIIGLDFDKKWPAVEFWKKYDAGEFDK
ncbi:MAG: protein kinase domain-containing protein, partial [Planctomycetota bacterium]